MDNLEALRAFVQVVALGGFSRAAAKLGISKSMVSRRVAALEAAVGVRLLSRTTRGVSLTDAGIELNTRAQRILAEIDDALEAVAGRDGGVAGTIRLAAPLSFGIAHLSSAIAAFAARYPNLQIDVSYSDRFVDVVADGFDAAIRIGSLKDSTLVARRLAPMRAVIAASPLYLARRGTPKHPRDIANHDGLIYSGSARGDVWRLRRERRTVSVRMHGRFRADNGELLREAAIAGLGIVVLPSWLVTGALASGALVQLFPEYEMPDTGLYVVRPPGPVAPGKVRALIDFLAERFGPSPYWDAALSGDGKSPAVA